jgi:hypothetical protein
MPQSCYKFSYPLIVLSEVPLKVPIPGMISGCTGKDHARKGRASACLQRLNLIKTSTQLQPGAVGSFWSGSDATVQNCQNSLDMSALR